MIIFAGNVFHNICNGATKNAAQIVDGGGIDGFVFTKFVDGGTGNAVILDQCIGGFGRALQCEPKWPITDHCVPPPRWYKSILGCNFYLDYSRKVDYNFR